MTGKPALFFLFLTIQAILKIRENYMPFYEEKIKKRYFCVIFFSSYLTKTKGDPLNVGE